MLLSCAQMAFYATFGAFASKNCFITAEHKPVSGAYRKLRIEADGVVQPGIDGDPESHEVRVDFIANDGDVTKYYIKSIVPRTGKQGGKLYRGDGTLLNDKALNASTYVPLIAGFYDSDNPASRLPEAREVAEVIYETGWVLEATHRNPATRQFLTLENFECEYHPRWLEAPETPFVVMFLFWLCSLLFNHDGKGPRRLYVTKKGFSWVRHIENSHEEAIESGASTSNSTQPFSSKDAVTPD